MRNRIKFLSLLVVTFLLVISCNFINRIMDPKGEGTDTKGTYDLYIRVLEYDTDNKIENANVKVRQVINNPDGSKTEMEKTGISNEKGEARIRGLKKSTKKDKVEIELIINAEKPGYKSNIIFVDKKQGDEFLAYDDEIIIIRLKKSDIDSSSANNNSSDSSENHYPLFVEKFDVPNDKAVYSYSKNILEKGVEYEITASGEVSVWSERTTGVDACYCYSCNPLRLDAILIINGKTMHDLNGKTLPYSKTHVYKTKIKGDGKKLKCYSRDAFSSGYNNNGSFHISISKTGN